MSIFRAASRRVKPVRVAPKPAAEFAEGIEPLSSRLPRVDGYGLSQEESFRLNRAGNTVKAQYAADCPDAESDELARVERAARKDALRSVLKDRPAAPCCDSIEDLPCLGCSSELATVPPAWAETDTTDEAWDYAEAAREETAVLRGRRWQVKREHPSFSVGDCDCEQWFKARPGITLEQVVAEVAEYCRARPEDFLSELVVWQDFQAVAVIARRLDGSPFVVMLDDHPDDRDEDDRDVLEKLDRENPGGVFRADLDRLPPPRFRPRLDETLLTLPQLIEREAERFRARGNAAGDLMAKTLDELVRVVRTVEAMTPADVEGRLEVLERDFTEPVEFEYEPELTASGRWA